MNVLAILYPISLANLAVEVGTCHSQQTLLANANTPKLFFIIDIITFIRGCYRYYLISLGYI